MSFHTFVDDRTPFEAMRLSDIKKIAKANGIEVTTEMTKASLLPILEGRGISAAPPAPEPKAVNPHAVSDARKRILEDIEKMRPSELYALAKEHGVEMHIRMTADERRSAKKKLVELM